MKKKYFIFFTLLVFSLGFPKLTQPLKTSPLPGLTLDQIKAIIDSASGERALNHIRHLTLFHRWFVSDGYHQAALYIKDKAREYGLSGVELEKFPSDGKIFYSTSKSLPKWTVREAELRMVSPVERFLLGWDENPIYLASNSRSADVRAELVDVGEGIHPSDYDGKDVRGKLVLASSPQGRGRIELVHRLAVLEKGAAGVISYRSYYLDDFPDLVTWDHIWTLEEGGKHSTFGFCIPKRMGWELKRLLNQGEKVILQVKVDAELSPGGYEILQGSIPGTDFEKQEVWFIAHLDHCLPSANDNASGSASILEAARSFIWLIERGILPRPLRTIRFLWVPEVYGTYAFISNHLEEVNRAVAVINMDMVGENQKLCGSTFQVTRTPDSTPSFLNDLLSEGLDLMLAHNPQPGRELTDPLAVISPLGTRDPWQARIIPFSGGSDHEIFMGGGGVNVPATMLGSYPDYFYHSSHDTPDKCDPTQLKRAMVLGMMVAFSIASMNQDSGLSFMNAVFPRSLQRMDEAAEKSIKMFQNSQLSGADLKQAWSSISCALEREKGVFRSFLKLFPENGKVESSVKSAMAQAERQAEALKEYLQNFSNLLSQQKAVELESAAPAKDEEQTMNLIPWRNPSFPGPLSTDYIALKLKEQGKSFRNPFTELQRYEIGAFIDGKRSILEIYNAVSAECGTVRLDDVSEYLKTLELCGLISWSKK